MTHETHELLSFVRQLPKGFAYTPVYAKGRIFGKHQDVSSGKAPYERAHHVVLDPADVALLIEQRPDDFAAVGVFTGIRSDGLVILDVDANLAALKRKWGDSLEGAPVVTSTKPNAAKYLFRVPVEQRSKVKGISGKVSKAGYEVLWGGQGLIAGVYPGSTDGTGPAGVYTLQGDLNAVPDAPEWLLAEMRAAKQRTEPEQGLIKNKKGLNFEGRSEDELHALVAECLSVLPHLGRGTEDFWWSIGAMIAEVLPNDRGLILWSQWSAEDPAFEDDWASGDPCADKWPHILKRAGRPGNKGLGSLIHLADEYDPRRERFQESSRKTLSEVEEAADEVLPAFKDIMREVKGALQLENPAEQKYELHKIAYKARMRDAFELEKMYVDQLQHESQDEEMTVKQLYEKDFNKTYLIPDLLPNPSVVLLYGAGGDGKSMAAWTLAKHVATGTPFVIRGKHVPVEQGPVLLLNGDQPLSELQGQLQEVEMPADAPVVLRNGWSLQAYARFQKLLESVKPKLVVIDSLIGCSGGRAFDENKSDFATPLYWLTRNNGVSFPACTIVIIHHANKTGGFRGTSAIRDAVDETWALKRPTDKEVERTGTNARLITIEKSRSGRGGTSLLMRQEADLCFSLADWTPEVDPAETTPSGVTDRVLQRLRVSYPAGKTRHELNADALCGGSVAAIRKSLQRLEKRGLIRVIDTIPALGNGGRPSHVYQAVVSLSRGEVEKVCPLGGKTSDSKGSGTGQGDGTEGGCPTPSLSAGAGGTHPAGDEGCLIADPLQDNGSTQKDTPCEYPHAREMRTPEELGRLKQAAADFWDAL